MKFNPMKIEEYAEVLANPRRFIESFCYITTKGGEFGLIKLNRPQRRLMKVIEDCLADNKPIRIRILKARQMGFSTLISALGFWWSAMNENSAYAVVAHKETSASSIFEKNKVFFDNLPKALKPMTNRFNSERISFNAPGQSEYQEVQGLRSKIFFGTAGGGELFRGETILFLHKSEVAFWEDKHGILKKSLNATVPLAPFTAIIEETTANGYNEWKDDWDRSQRGEDSYITFFAGWQEMEEYSLTPPADFKPTEKELELQMEFDLTNAQLFWRRQKIADDYSGNELWFKQEYPMTPLEAFIASGMSVFDNDTLVAGYAGCKKPLFEKEIMSVMVREKLLIWEEPEVKEDIEYEQLVRFNEEKQDYEYYDGEVEVGRKMVHANYTIGVDTSGMGADWNHVVVWHNVKKNMVARFSIKNIREELLALIIVEIGNYYFGAKIAVETNYSHAIYDYILKTGYDNLYYTENYARVDKKKEAIEYGWQTTGASKNPLISTLRSHLAERPESIRDEEFWYQAEYYILEKISTDGRHITNAAKGHFDDLIIASAIAHIVSCSFQSKQNYSTKKIRFDKTTKKNDILIGGVNIGHTRKTNKLRKGVYNNNA